MGAGGVGYQLDVRPYGPADFPTVEGWWRAHHGNDFRPGYISNNAYIVIGAGDMAFFSMCPMCPDFCYLGFPLVNPNLQREKRDAAVDFMVECAKLWAERNGFPIVWVSIRGEKMLNRLSAAGFIRGEGGNTHMFCKVGVIR